MAHFNRNTASDDKTNGRRQVDYQHLAELLNRRASAWRDVRELGDPEALTGGRYDAACVSLFMQDRLQLDDGDLPWVTYLGPVSNEPPVEVDADLYDQIIAQTHEGENLLGRLRAEKARQQQDHSNGHHQQREAPPKQEPPKQEQKQAPPVDWRAIIRPVEAIISEPEPETEWQVEGLIPRGWAGMILADSKVGKTLLVLQLAKAKATGADFLGKKCPAGKVVLILADDPRALSKKRLREMLSGVPPATVYAFIDRWTPTTLDAVRACVDEIAPDLVVADTLIKTAPKGMGAENDPVAMNDACERLTALTANERTTVLWLHHKNAAGGSRGTTAIPASAPIEIHLDTDAEPGATSREVTLSVVWKLEPIEPIVLLHEKGQFTSLGSKTQRRRSQLDTEILAYLAAHPNQSGAEVAREVKRRDMDVRERLEAMEADGLVTHDGEGRTTKWRVVTR